MRKLEVQLHNGTVVLGDYFEESDFDKIKAIFKKWQDINADLNILGGRALNVPDVVSEAIYCYFFDAVRTNKTAKSYDAVNIVNHDGVQIKSTSINTDLTSFGPRSTWDELYFIDFAPNGKVDGMVDIYKIDTDIRDIVLNNKGETFANQQAQGRRPRFSIKQKIIAQQNLQPIIRIDLTQ
jgi:hypothetical protein